MFSKWRVCKIPSELPLISSPISYNLSNYILNRSGTGRKKKVRCILTHLNHRWHHRHINISRTLNVLYGEWRYNPYSLLKKKKSTVKFPFPKGETCGLILYYLYNFVDLRYLKTRYVIYYDCHKSYLSRELFVQQAFYLSELIYSGCKAKFSRNTWDPGVGGFLWSHTIPKRKAFRI